MSTKRSQRFEGTFFTRKVVPVIFTIILLGLVATLIVTGLSVAGVTPGA